MVDEQTTQVADAVGAEAAVPDTSNEPMWYEGLSDGLRTNKNITKFHSLEDFASWQANASKLMGKKVQELSPDEVKQFLTPEELLEAANARGIPNTVEDYLLPSVDSVGDPRALQGLKEIAIREGIAPSQTEALIQYHHQVQQEAMLARKEEWTNNLIHTYGNKAADELTLAQSAAARYCSPELMRELDQAGLGHHPEIVKAFAKVAREMMPDNVPRGHAVTTNTQVKTQAEIDQLIRDPEFNQRWKRRDSKAIAQLDALYAKLDR